MFKLKLKPIPRHGSSHDPVSSLPLMVKTPDMTFYIRKTMAMAEGFLKCSNPIAGWLMEHPKQKCHGFGDTPRIKGHHHLDGKIKSGTPRR